jgi:hypothetical protein
MGYLLVAAIAFAAGYYYKRLSTYAESIRDSLPK